MSFMRHKVDGEYNSCTMLVLRLYRMYAKIVLNVFSLKYRNLRLD